MGDPERPDRLRPLPGRLQHQRDDARGQGQADPLPQPPRGRRGLALRQGPLRLLAPAAPATGSRIRCARPATAASSRSSGTRRSTRPSELLARGRRRDRHRALGLRDGRAGLRARASCCASGSARTRPCCPRRSPTGSTPSARRSPRSATRRPSSSSATSPSSSARRSSTSGSRPPAATARAILTELPDEPVEGAVLITDDAEHAAWFARDLERDRRLLPAAHAERPRRRRRLELRRRRRARATSSRLLVVISGDEAAADPGVRALAERADARDRDRHVRGVVPRPRRPRPPGHELPRARRHDASTSRAASSASAAR